MNLGVTTLSKRCKIVCHVIAFFTLGHQQIRKSLRPRLESVVCKELREYLMYPKVCEATIKQLTRRDMRAALYPVIVTVPNLMYSLRRFLKLHPSMNIFKKRVPFTVFQSIVDGTYPGNRTLCITFASHLFLARRENAWAFHFLAANCLWCVKYLQTYPIPLRSISPSSKG
jgi:hypothetical protein